MPKDPRKLKELLEAEQYPHRYLHKFIGRNTPEFMASVAALEARFPKAVRTGERQSGESQSYLALTYELLADTPDEILVLLEATAEVRDLKLIL